jgi:hypothetical protein
VNIDEQSFCTVPEDMVGSFGVITVRTGLFAVGGPRKGIRKHFPECRLNFVCCRRFPDLIERLLVVDL